jgi:hypothetical protein
MTALGSAERRLHRLEPAELLYGRLLASAASGDEAVEARFSELVAPGGAVLVETGPPSAPTRRVRVRLEARGAISPWFGWATVGAAGIEPLARAAGLDHRARISAGGRWFARLERPR